MANGKLLFAGNIPAKCIAENGMNSNDRNISGKNMQEKQMNKRKWGH